MIDFNNAYIMKLHPDEKNSFANIISPILVGGEQIISSYKSVRDGVVFTTKRIITINVQGVTGKKKDFTSLPYNKIQAFSVETAGFLDTDCELELWFSGLGKVKIEFINTLNISEICKLISEKVL